MSSWPVNAISVCRVSDFQLIDDELIVPEEEVDMVRDFMFTSGSCEVSDKYSLFSMIKTL